MSIKRNNILLMWFALVFTAGQLFLNGVVQTWSMAALISYGICVIVGLILMKRDGVRFLDVLPFNVGIKSSTALRIIALTFLMKPLDTLLGQVGALLGGDLLEVFSQQFKISEQSILELFFSVAVVPAVFEELFFRGFLYLGFKRARGARFAIIFTSILFGFYHMNIQQIMYAVVLGILLAVLREVTGSMWAGCLFHFVNNGWGVVDTVIDRYAAQGSFLRKLPLEMVSFVPGGGEAVSTGILIYSIIMLVVCTALSVWIVIRIARNEDRLPDLKSFFKNTDGPKERVVTFPLIVACFIYVFMTLILTLSMKLMAIAGTLE